MTDQYDQFAADYDWLFSDFARVGERYVAGLSETLRKLPDDAKILDCACGTGITILALARHGFHAAGTDASEGMILRARQNMDEGEVDVPLEVCSWENLPSLFAPEYDMVLCGGNSIGHCRDEHEMLRSLGGIHHVLKPGGLLVLDTRNWDKLLAERIRFTHFGARQRYGKRCVPLYVWTFPEKSSGPVTVEVLLPIEADGVVALKVFEIVYHPFRSEELMERLQCAGFVAAELTYTADRSAYTVSARKGSATPPSRRAGE